MEKTDALCFICNQSQCLEDADHLKYTKQQFYTLLKSKAPFNPHIPKLIHKIKKAFSLIKTVSSTLLLQQFNRVQIIINKLHFWYLLEYVLSLKDVELSLYGAMLQKSQITRLIACLNQENKIMLQFPAFPELFLCVKNFNRKIKQNVSFSDYQYLGRQIAGCIDRQQQVAIQGQRIRSFCQHPQRLGIDYVFINGMPFNAQKKSLDLSKLSIDDQKLIELIASVQKLRQLEEFKIKNSSITKKGFRILFNALSETIESLDLSGNNYHNFIEFVENKFPNLKTLSLNETKINSLESIEGLICHPQLEVINLDGNQISISKQWAQKLKVCRSSSLKVYLKKRNMFDQDKYLLQAELKNKNIQLIF